MSILLIVFSYLLGSISFGYLIAKKIKKVDIRKIGSGNTGATNISRILGFKFALAVLLLDVGKGLLAVLLARWLDSGSWTILLCAFAVILGHNWPVFFSFQGGRGAATTLGVFLGIIPLAALITFGIFIVVILVTRYVSLGSLIGAILIPVFLLYYRYPPEYFIFGLAVTALIIWRHIPNIKRLLQGKESKIGEKVNITPKR